MKTTIIMLVFGCLIHNISAQSFITNSVVACKIYNNAMDRLRFTMDAISFAYDVRICTDDSIDYRTSKWPLESIVLTDETFATTLENYMQNTTNLTWKYEENTKTIYIYPVTNAFIMKRYGPVSVTNVYVHDLFDETNILGLETNSLLRVGGHKDWGWPTEKVSFYFQEAYLWEIFDAIEAQVDGSKSWSVTKRKQQED